MARGGLAMNRPRGLMTDDKIRCPRCHSADVVMGSQGERKCEECRFLLTQTEPPIYGLDSSANLSVLDDEAAARHKKALAKAAGGGPIIIGIDPNHVRGVLTEARRQVLQEMGEVPWYKPHTRIKFKAFAAAFSAMAKTFTGEPV